MNTIVKDFGDFINSAIEDLKNHKIVATELKCNEETINNFDKVVVLANALNEIAINENIKINYINQFKTDLNNILGTLPFRGTKDFRFIARNNEEWREQIKKQFEASSLNILNHIDQIEFNIDFFKKIGFFSKNVIAIGANGSGKTSLSDKFKNYLQNNGVVISAQRILLIPNIASITNPSQTAAELKDSQQRDKTNKNPNEFGSLSQEFGIVLRNLLAENISLGNQYRINCVAMMDSGDNIPNPPITKLDKTLKIWNKLLEHRKIDCNDGMNIMVKYDSVKPYPAFQMSDGEKVMLYLIGQVLQAPKEGFIVVDEPEMYLHKTILTKLWDILEEERQDCLFVYLTHDLDFAASRTTAKKIWIKSFIFPNKWEIESIPDNEIPETLLYELLGSRKNILFCEGIRGSIDEKIYNILFPNYTITPVGNCFQVISHTKAFNKLSNVQIKAIGLIDSDHHSGARLQAIKEECIYSFNIVEPENLLLDEDFLFKLASKIMKGKNEIDQIKEDILHDLQNEKDLQVANFVSAKVDYYFKETNVVKGNNLDSVKLNYESFTKEIKIDEWYESRQKWIEKIIESKDYKSVLSVFNNKGLKRHVSRNFKISDFTQRALELLHYDTTTHADLKKYFPIEIK